MRRVIAKLVLLLAAGLWIHRKPGAREIRLGSIEDPSAAQAYLAISELPHFKLIRWLITRELTALDAGGRALDLGSGPGKLAIGLAREAPRQVIVGAEPSEEMVALANHNAAEAGLSDRVTFKVGTAEAIPLPDASVDVLVSTLALHHWIEPTKGLREVGRVVRPGGRYLIMDLRRDMAILPWMLVNVARYAVLPQALRRIGEPVGSVRAAYTPPEVERLAGEAGLKDFVVEVGPAWLILDGIAT